jgi:hypothetical protein
LSYITHIPDAKVYGKNPSDSVKAENFLIIWEHMNFTRKTITTRYVILLGTR